MTAHYSEITSDGSQKRSDALSYTPPSTKKLAQTLKKPALNSVHVSNEFQHLMLDESLQLVASDVINISQSREN